VLNHPLGFEIIAEKMEPQRHEGAKKKKRTFDEQIALLYCALRFTSLNQE